MFGLIFIASDIRNAREHNLKGLQSVIWDQSNIKLYNYTYVYTRKWGRPGFIAQDRTKWEVYVRSLRHQKLRKNTNRLFLMSRSYDY